MSKKNDVMIIKLGEWHQIINPNNSVCKIIELQYGDKTIEEDIVRHSYYEGNNDPE